MPPPCLARPLLDQLADRWAPVVLIVLGDGPARFNAVKRAVVGVSQKVLGDTLRRLERTGLIERRVLSERPLAVQYSLSEMGSALLPTVRALRAFGIAHHDEITEAQARFDREAEHSASKER